MAQVKLLVGLGNPGRKYARTRHNLGFMLLDYLARLSGAKFRAGKGDWKQARLTLEGHELWAIKPETYMNRSGLAVSGFCRYHNLQPPEVLVICDDINLPLGRLRLRRDGSAGGHKGLEDIIASLGSDRFMRLRLGIGLPSLGEAAEEYVLKGFEKEEKEAVANLVETAGRAVIAILKDGLTAAQNQYN
jgi:PTH1 family peptidyl-tRNA hydrolase